MKAAFKYFFIWLLLMFAGVFIFALPAVGVSLLTGGNFYDQASIMSDPWFLPIAMLGGYLVPLLFFWKMKYTRFNFKFDFDFGSAFSYQNLYLWSAIGCIGCFMIVLILGCYIKFPDWNTEGLEELATMANNPIGIFVICLLGPLVEETVFRGAIERRLLEKSWKPWLAILVSALLFAVAHGNFSQGLTATILGCFLGWVYYRTRNLWPCVLIHALNNTSACVLGWTASGTPYEDPTQWPIHLHIITIGLGIILLYYAIKMIAHLTKDRTPLPTSEVTPPPLAVEPILPPTAVSQEEETPNSEIPNEE